MTKSIAPFFLYLLVFASQVQAQQNRYVAFFTDKDNSVYSIASPEDYLSARAIERRINQNILITETDLPVNQAYVNGLKTSGANVFFTTKWLNAALIQADPADLQTLQALEFVDSIAFVAPGQRLTPLGRKYNIEAEKEIQAPTDDQLRMLGIDDLQQENLLGEGQLIAYFDGGFVGTETAEAFQHIYSSNRLLYTFDLVENNYDVYRYSTHGTKVFSITAGYLPNVFEGSAYGAEYMLFVTEDVSSEYRIEEFNWLIAAEKADSAGVDIINSSLGYSTFDDPAMDYTYQDMDGETTVVTQAAAFAAARGILVVVSAGNEGNNSWQYITAPADAADVISVGAVNAMGERADFSSIGPAADGRIKPEIVAQGARTALIDQSGTVATGSGTSFSAPLITGLAAGIWQAYPDLTNLQLRTMILESGDRANAPDNFYGFGIPNYNVVKSRIEKGFIVFPNPITGSELKIAQFTARQPHVEATLYGSTGALIDKFVLRFSQINQIQAVSLDQLQAGIYILWLNSGTVSQKFRIVKY